MLIRIMCNLTQIHHFCLLIGSYQARHDHCIGGLQPKNQNVSVIGYYLLLVNIIHADIRSTKTLFMGV